MNDQGFGVADVGEQAEQLERVDKALTGFVAAAYAEGDDRACAVRQVFLSERVVLARFEAGIVDPLDFRVSFEEARHLKRVLRMTLHAQVQRLCPLQQEKGVEWRQARARIAQA